MSPNGEDYTNIATLHYSPPWHGHCQAEVTRPQIIDSLMGNDDDIGIQIVVDENTVSASPCGAATDPCGQMKQLSEEGNSLLPTKFVLYQNRPNPFNPTTIISYKISVTEHVILEIYNVIGQKDKNAC